MVCIFMHKILCQLVRYEHFINVIPFGPWLNANAEKDCRKTCLLRSEKKIIQNRDQATTQ